MLGSARLCCAAALPVPEAARIFEEMNEAGVAPSLMTYNTLISGCVRAQAPSEALSVFYLMKERG
ncbi:unnamed protein product, partial [Ectocarpus sp. 12 AP-2014]